MQTTCCTTSQYNFIKTISHTTTRFKETSMEELTSHEFSCNMAISQKIPPTVQRTHRTSVFNHSFLEPALADLPTSPSPASIPSQGHNSSNALVKAVCLDQHHYKFYYFCFQVNICSSGAMTRSTLAELHLSKKKKKEKNKFYLHSTFSS